MKIPSVLLLVAAQCLLGLLVESALAETLEPTADTFSTITFNTAHPPVAKAATIASASGISGSMLVSRSHHAFVQFNAGATLQADGFAATDILSAKLTIYFPSVTKAGSIDLDQVTQSWSEKFTGPAKDEPAVDPLPIEEILPQSVVAKQFITVDVTSTVQGWLNDPSTDHGFAFESPDGVVSAAITAKEGPGSGYPATLEIVTGKGGYPSLTEDPNSGSLGIGTTTPQAPLDIARTAAAVTIGSSSLSSSFSLEITNNDQHGTISTPDVAGIGFGSSDSMRQAIVGGTYGNDFLDFFTAGDLTNPKMSIAAGGDVGIGTISPVSLLEVDGTITAMPAVGNYAFVDLNGDSTLNIGLNGNNTAFVQNTNGAIEFQTLNLTRMHVDTTGRVGIGTTAPATLLEVDGTITSSPAVGAFALVDNNGSSTLNFGLNGSNTGFIDNTNGSIEFETSGSIRMHVDKTTGDVGIGKTNPSTLLDVNGTITCTGFNNASDARFKMNVQPLSGALEQTLRLRGVSYDWDRARFPDKGFDDRRQLGFLAQEVREILPNVVSQDRDGYLSIGYTEIIPVLAEAVKQLKQQKDAEIAALQEKVSALETRDAAREARLTRLENALEARPAQPVKASLEFK